MANPVNVFDFTNETLATFLAKLVSDGDYDNVLGDLKIDQTGEEAAATQIFQKIGQLWGNVMDDYLQASYPQVRNVALGNGGLLHTTGAAKIGAYTALVSELVRYDATAGTFTVDVPASPANNARFGIVETGNNATQITIDGGANAVIGPGGTSGLTILVGSARGTLTWEFNSVDSTWSLVSDAGAAAGGAVTHASTTGQTANDHHAQLHAAAHADGAGDELIVEGLATATTAIARGLKPDGSGGLAFGPILDAQPGTFSTGIKFHADVGNTASYAAGQATTLLDVVAGKVGTIANATLTDGRLNFDGADTLVNFGPVSSAVAGLFDGVKGFAAVWCLIFNDGEGNLGVLIDAGYGDDGKNWLFTVSGQSGAFVKLTFTHAFTTTDGIWTTTDADVPINSWVELGVLYDGTGDPTFYKNGKTLGAVTEDQTPSGTPDTGTTADLVLGNHADASATFDGWMEVFTMWTTAVLSGNFILGSFDAKASRFGTSKSTAGGDGGTGGFGSTNGHIRLWDNETSSGPAFIPVPSAANGDSWRCIVAGNYTFTTTLQNTTAGSSRFAINKAAALNDTFIGPHLRGVAGLAPAAQGATATNTVSARFDCAKGDLVWVSTETNNLAIATVADVVTFQAAD